MNRRVYITTSWDDGHPCDLRVAELLRKHGLCGTFYVPRAFDDQPVVCPRAYDKFGTEIEVGAHTLNHVMLTREDRDTTQKEITGSKVWLEDTTGIECTMFCPPWGKFNATHLTQCAKAGFAGVRSVEAWSTQEPKRVGRVAVLPTTVQALSVPKRNHARNLAKRLSVSGLLNWARFGRGGTWEVVTDRILSHVSSHGGVLHLWGHSWEVDDHGQWDALERVLSRLGEFCTHGSGVPVTNGQLVEQFLSPAPTRTHSPENEQVPTGSVLAGQANWAKDSEPENAGTVSPARISTTSTETLGVNTPFLAQASSLRRWLRSLPASRGPADFAVTLPHGRLASAVRRIARVSRSR